ncbi:MAG: hypothetical protein Q4C87_11650 [Actinomycetaceae bacterium]|nr:hypothetical protein [Actinomycetaceae bacterium]
MTWMDYIAYAEQTRGVTLPEVYHRLAADGMLDWGPAGPRWSEEVFPRLLKHPPFLLISSDVELVDSDSMLTDHFDCEFAFELKPEYKQAFIPFVTVGNGDLYVFAYLDGASTPLIVRLKHDWDSEILANDLQDWMFMQILEADRSWNCPDEDDEGFRRVLLTQLESHRPYLKPTHYDLLKEVYSREFHDSPHGDRILVSPEEAEDLINKYAPCSRRGEEFDPYI